VSTSYSSPPPPVCSTLHANVTLAATGVGDGLGRHATRTRMRVRVTVAGGVTRTVWVTMWTPWGRRATVSDADAGTDPPADGEGA